MIDGIGDAMFRRLRAENLRDGSRCGHVGVLAGATVIVTR